MASRRQRRSSRSTKNRSQDVQRRDLARRHGSGGRPRRAVRPSAETKDSRRTTELVAYVAAVLGIVLAALALDADGRGGADPFGAEQALRYIALLTIGYMLARGLAKAGSHGKAVDHAVGDGLQGDLLGKGRGADDAGSTGGSGAVDDGEAGVGRTGPDVDTPYLGEAPDGHSHQDGHAHRAGHPHNDGHVHAGSAAHDETVVRG